MYKIDAQNVTFKIGESLLIQDISVNLEAGKLTALVGPNGSGKTTLLRILAGLLVPNEGVVTLDGKDLQTFSRLELARKIAFVPQDTHIDFAFKVKEIVEMGRHAHLGRFMPMTKHDFSVVGEALGRADVSHLAFRNVTELSGGERQRVIIARSLATEADIMLLDEPTASLDIAHALDVLNLCRELAAEGKTIALAIHDLNLAVRYAENAVLLNKGKIVTQGKTSEVLQRESLNQVFDVCTDSLETTDGKPVFVFHREKKSLSSRNQEK